MESGALLSEKACIRDRAGRKNVPVFPGTFGGIEPGFPTGF